MTPYDPYGNYLKKKKKKGQKQESQGTAEQAGSAPPQGQALQQQHSEHFFRDEKGNFRCSLVEEEAEKWADKFRKPQDRGDKVLTPHQLRRFYQEVKALQNRVRASGFEKTLPFIRILKAKIAYACPERGDRRVPKEFRDYIENMVDNVRTEQDFEDFALCFEAVVGYFGGGER